MPALAHLFPNNDLDHRKKIDDAQQHEAKHARQEDQFG